MLRARVFVSVYNCILVQFFYIFCYFILHTHREDLIAFVYVRMCLCVCLQLFVCVLVHLVYFILILLFAIRFYFLYSLFVVAVICVSVPTAFVAEGGGGFGLSFYESRLCVRLH